MAQEVAARGPQDLRPLAFKPPHGELAALVDNINALLQRVDASAARERSFIADATHELRTPLAAMRVNVEALQGQAHDARQQELLDGILNSGNRAARLVGQLLQLTRSEVQADAGELPRRQALDTLLQDRLAALSGLAQAGDIELELQASVSLSVPGQRESLVSLIDNLVENAIKYSPRGSSVTVSLHAERGQAVLHVADQGPGIAPALYERVFDRFFRAPQQAQPGSGLGLSIVASVVRQHGGTIQLHSGNGGLGLLVPEKNMGPVGQHHKHQQTRGGAVEQHDIQAEIRRLDQTQGWRGSNQSEHHGDAEVGHDPGALQGADGLIRTRPWTVGDGHHP